MSPPACSVICPIITASAQITVAPTDLLKDPTISLKIFQYVVLLSFRQFDRHDSWMRLCRIVARIISFLLRIFCRKISRQQLPSEFVTRKEQRAWLDLNDHYAPSPAEMQLAAAVLAYRAQRSMTPKLVASMGKLNPAQDAYGLWHAMGRVHELQSAPVIIPSESKLALVLLATYHNKLHSGADATLASVREKFWIIRGQVLANQVVASCVICRKAKKKPIHVEMAPLHPFRFQPAAVFSTVYMDLCGPYFCKSDGRTTRANLAHATKVWILVVVCALSHAVHLEVVENYGTSGFLSALDTFVNFRSKPLRIITDSGSQIKGAEGALNPVWSEINFDTVRNHFCDTTEWIFAPPGAHAFVGMAERVVAVVKASFEVTTCSKQPCLEKLQFARLLYATANLINDRPLTVGRNRVSKLDEPRLIRPNDLLFGRTTAEITPMADIDFNDLSGKHEHFFAILKQRSVFLNEFWKKFHQLVFHTLLPRQKWLTSGRPLQLADLVLIKDVNPIRGIWTLGRVEKILDSIDGKPRQALVRYRESLGRKAAHKTAQVASKIVFKSVRDLCLVLERDNDN